ncbi:MAG: hypothetical protein PUD26_02170 [bacterium]|nr:hypothetical protein [bacterium]
MSKQHSTPKYDVDHWLNAAQRYFDASLSPQEEQELKQFVAATSDERFLSLKAVMGFAATGRKVHAKPHRSPLRRTIVRLSAAACLALTVSAVGLTLYRQANYHISYVGGVQSTDNEQAMMLMHSAMKTVDINSSGVAVEEQLHDIFNTLNQSQAL